MVVYAKDKVRDKDRLVDLCRALHVSRRAFQPFRNTRMAIVRAMAGKMYSDQAADKEQLINLLGIYKSIVIRNLVSKEPRVMLSTFNYADEPAVRAMETWLNEDVERISFANTIQRAAEDALCYMGCTANGIATPADAAMSGGILQAGDPFLFPVDMEDLIVDLTAKEFPYMQYASYRVRAIKEVVLESKFYSKEGRDRLKDTAYDDQRVHPDGDQRIGSLSWLYNKDGEAHEMIDLWITWCPYRKCIYTFSEADLSGPTTWERNGKVKPLGEQTWVGHERGPLNYLAFGRVIGNLVPKGPMLDLFGMADMGNEIFRKLEREAADFREITLVPQNNPEDAARFGKANDGDIVPVQNPKDFTVVQRRGPNANLGLFFQQVVKLFDWAAGNMSSMGGLAAQAGTLGQEELLHTQSAGQVVDMQENTVKFVLHNIESLLDLWWKHPQKTMKSRYSVKGEPDVWMARELGPRYAPNKVDTRTGQQFNVLRRDGEMPKCKIDAYSMRHSTPAQKAKELLELIGVLQPLAGLLQQQGEMLDVNELLNMFSKYRDLPEIKKLWKTVDVPQQTQGDVGGNSAGPSNTKREYVRHDVGNSTGRDQNAQMETQMEAMASSQQGESNASAA